MSSVGPAGAVAAVTTTDFERPKVSNSADAARQFEALLIGFMLKSGRESGSSWLGGGEDSANASAIGYAEEQLARALSSKGGLGLAKMITAGLEDQSRAYSKAGGVTPGETSGDVKGPAAPSARP
jgi:Rod binding domain-containing protein